MKYRVRCDLILNVEDEAVAHEIVKTLHNLKEFFRSVKSGELVEENSYIFLEKCFHDEMPSKPCKKIFEWVSRG